MDRLLITGASGQLGRRVTELVLQQSPPEHVIVVTRQPHALAHVAARGAAVRFGDFANPGSLRSAFTSADRMLLISATDLARRGDQHRAAIAAAVDAGVRHVSYTSMLSPDPPNPAVIAPSHQLTERTLMDSGLAWTVLRNSLYAEYQVAEATRAIATGTFVHNRGAGRIAYVSREDCAAVAAAVLTGGGHAGKIYDVTGADTFDASDLATLYGELGGRPVAGVAMDDDAFVAELLRDGARDEHARYGAALVASLGRSIREGFFARCTETVATLTGRPPRTLREVLQAGGAVPGRPAAAVD